MIANLNILLTWLFLTRRTLLALVCLYFLTELPRRVISCHSDIPYLFVVYFSSTAYYYFEKEPRMAFMMPVMKNDYNIYASRSRTSSSSSSTVQPYSRRCTQSESAPVSLSCSPGSDVEERLAAISLGCSPRRDSHFASELQSPKSASQTSLTKFHARVVEKLRKKLRSKDQDDESAKNKTQESS